MSEDVSLAIHDCALGISPVTSYSGAKSKVGTYTLALFDIPVHTGISVHSGI